MLCLIIICHKEANITDSVTIRHVSIISAEAHKQSWIFFIFFYLLVSSKLYSALRVSASHFSLSVHWGSFTEAYHFCKITLAVAFPPWDTAATTHTKVQQKPVAFKSFVSPYIRAL